MTSFFAIILLLILVLAIITISIVLLVKYVDKRDNGKLYFHIKVGPLEFEINTSAKNVIKRVDND